MARRLMAEAGMMMPTSDSDGTFLPKVSGVLLLRMSLHWRLCATPLLYHSRSRTPPSQSQHLDSCTLHDRVGAGFSLLGRGYGALSTAWYYKTHLVTFSVDLQGAAYPLRGAYPDIPPGQPTRAFIGTTLGGVVRYAWEPPCKTVVSHRQSPPLVVCLSNSRVCYWSA